PLWRTACDRHRTIDGAAPCATRGTVLAYRSAQGGSAPMHSADENRHRSTPAGVRITGVGAEIPQRVVTTAELEEQAAIDRFGFEPGWLERARGVTERRWAEPDVTPSDLAAAAARAALVDAGREPGDIDTVIFAGITKDYLEPAAANIVADAVGAERARVF